MGNKLEMSVFKKKARKNRSQDSLSITLSSHVTKPKAQCIQDANTALPDVQLRNEFSSPCSITKNPHSPKKDQEEIQREIDDENDLAAEIANVVNTVSCNSKLFDVEKEAKITRLDHFEIKLGSILGQGGFSTVNEISEVKLKVQSDSLNSFRELVSRYSARRKSFGKFSDFDPLPSGGSFSENSTSKISIENIKVEQPVSTKITTSCDSMGWEEDDMLDQVHDRNFISKRCIRNGDARYAFKTLKPISHDDPEKIYTGIIDLAIEARFLAVIKHPHIIKMRAMSLGNPFKKGYFIVLDRLYNTLSETLSDWKKKERKNMAILNKLSGKMETKNKKLWIKRLAVAYDLSSAMTYLHDHNILYRDLKPENIGFDVRGDVKLFDFGLAIELHDEMKNSDGFYDLDGGIGSLRYMAPEVALSLPYNLSADVYSFGILMWQIFSLQTPFGGYSREKHHDLVVVGGKTPELVPSWSSGIIALLQTSWCKYPTVRSNFRDVSDVLKREVESLYRGQEQIDISNKSQNSQCSL